VPKARKRTDTLPVSASLASPHVAQEIFYEAQNDKHSDLTDSFELRYGNGCCCGFSPRFPYPRASTVMRYARQRICKAYSDELCLFFFVSLLYHKFFLFSRVFCKKRRSLSGGCAVFFDVIPTARQRPASGKSRRGGRRSRLAHFRARVFRGSFRR